MYEKSYRLGLLGKEGNPPTRDNSSPHKQALRSLVFQEGTQLRPCLYEGELSPVGGLPSIPSHLLQNVYMLVYMKRVAPVDRVKVDLA